MKTTPKRIITDLTKNILALLILIFSFSTAKAQQVDPDKTIKYNITKNTSDLELGDIAKNVNKENIGKLTFSKTKRNKQGELTNLDMVFHDKDGGSLHKNQYNSEGIAAVDILLYENFEGERSLEIENTSSSK